MGARRNNHHPKGFKKKIKKGRKEVRPKANVDCCESDDENDWDGMSSINHALTGPGG